MSAGNPRCHICHGRGGWRSAFGWQRCPCTRPTKDQKQAIRRLHSVGTDRAPEQLRLEIGGGDE